MTHIFKTTMAGNGALYAWMELDEKGEVVRQSEQMFASEADAEKAIRTVATSSDIIEVESIKNVNVLGNTNVNLVKPEVLKDQFYGMNVVSKSVLDTSEDAEDEVEEEEHANVAKMEDIHIPKVKAHKKAKTSKGK